MTCDLSGGKTFLGVSSNCIVSCPTTDYRYELTENKRCYTTCPSGSLNYDNPAGYKECIDSCATGNYTEGDDCLPCFNSCETCSAGAATDCITCKTGFPFKTEDSQCVDICPDPLYTYTLNNSQLCYTDCPAGSLNYDVGGKNCIEICGDSNFVSGNDCLPCHVTCFQCTSDLETNCTECNLSGTYPWFTESNTCVTGCDSA